ncbi:MAG TPA: OmpA family protein [Hyphomonadaceae bacterium]|nr:OmpA family protein [Hyphomonadaceae bacterium]
MKPHVVWTAISVVAMVAACSSASSQKTVSGPTSFSAAAISPVDASSCRDGSIDIYFNQWEYELNSFSREVLTKAQASLAGCRIEHVLIIGLADATAGDEQASLEVSQKRAQTIADALEAGGWSRSQFELVAIGGRGAVVDGVNAPMRRRANVSVKVSTP